MAGVIVFVAAFGQHLTQSHFLIVLDQDRPAVGHFVDVIDQLAIGDEHVTHAIDDAHIGDAADLGHDRFALGPLARLEQFLDAR